ncbi:hypothetical protein AVL62_06465 [Serinicoccus chungangensis]|uniref:Uncharacterized protein n=1 Tax=Serinicoccus chungangensis TaxID=767452 RepID=A0A0W8IHG3_9MICO|nr:hypothetical protein [Serinicoccus chungangensis]KUG59318.1 hypothetical protein AVL62_06465 [Serinicoccus chungangensis]
MKKPTRVPIFGIVLVVVLVNVFSSWDVPMVPIIIGLVIVSMVTGQGRRPGSLGGRPGSGGRPGTSPQQPAGDTSELPRIDVPRYPDEATPPPLPRQGSGAVEDQGAAAYPTSTSTDPVVSLGQLHLGRLGRELDTAARTGTGADVARLLGEIDQLVERSLMMLSGAHGGPGSGRKEFESGLRRLAREVDAAHGEEPAGSRVARVVQTSGSLARTGRHG